ncbi:MAG: hypothetical protein KIT72_04675 [Polyangiaceae bacterium]|nr:hypothetical protein [Polyangiaceae bacterium]MCW5789698.1 hypothetical protein [Polyangiaceae bacterium]
MPSDEPLSPAAPRGAPAWLIARRLITWAVGLWVGLYLLGLALAPGRAGALPWWADPIELAPSAVRSALRVVLGLGLAWLLSRALRAAWREPGELGRLTRVGVTCSLLGPLLHAGRALARRAGEGYFLDGNPATELAAELSATHFGIPWLALGYLVSAAGLALWSATLTFSAAARRDLSPELTRGLSWGVGLLTLLVVTRPLVYYATGDDLLRRQDVVTPLGGGP